jgi:hypothetical protein
LALLHEERREEQEIKNATAGQSTVELINSLVYKSNNFNNSKAGHLSFAPSKMHGGNATNNPRIPVISGMFPFQEAQSSDEGKRHNGEDDIGVIDPWDVYGGNSNIAAACRAANEEVQNAKKDDAEEHDEKQRQLAAGRLTGWQSRERKNRDGGYARKKRLSH